MKLKNIFLFSKWFIDKKKYHELYDYDLKFNASFRGVKQLSKRDMKRYEIRYLKYYRLAQASEGSFWYRLWFFPRLYKFSLKTGVGLYENMHIPKGLIIGHSGTIVMNGSAIFNGNIMLTHGVTIGRDIRGKRAGAPTFGKNVCVRCNSTVVGNITIGDDVLIAPNTFVNFDVPSHSIVIGNPASIHHKENATEGHIGKVFEND